jgi:hypothetical protein
VTRFDRNDLRRFALDDAAVGVLDVNLALGEEADVGVHAEVGTDRRLHVLGPVESRWIHHPLDACGAGAGDIELDVTDVAPLRAIHRREQRIARASGRASLCGLACLRRRTNGLAFHRTSLADL